MKTSFFTTLGLAALLVAGCSSTPTKVDTGPIHAQSFSFISRAPKGTAEFADKREHDLATIRECITTNLTAKGLVYRPAGGDVTVAYLVILGNNVTTVAIDDYFGYGRDTYALLDKASDAYSSSQNPSYFEAGTLLVDIIDAKTYKLLKRSYVVRPLLRDPPSDVRTARIQEAVDAVLQDVRIAP